jgi:phosphate:Na+ symporter
MDHFSLVWFLGAVAIFLYGIRVSRIGLQLWGGDRLRGMIASLTENRCMGLAVGAFVTLILQSSSATSNMLVSFADAGLMTLSQSMGVQLGAGIGTTLVVVLLSVRAFSEYAMIVLVIGVAIDMMSRRKKTRYISMLFIGFGFIFLGLHLMTMGAESLKDHPFFLQFMTFLSENTFYSFFLSSFITIFLSSAGTIGLAIAFAFSGALNFEAALPFVLGANLGTCFTSVIASFSGNTAGKRVAVANLVFKAVGVAIFLPFLDQFAEGVNWLALQIPGLGASVSGRIALSHMIFNLAVSIAFLPFIRQGVWLVQKMVPTPRSELEKRFAPKYLDPKSLETPSLAFANVKREILRAADLVLEMFRECLRCYERSDPDLVVDIESNDDKVDLLDREMKLFLASLSQENLTDDQAKMSLTLLSLTGALEEIGDIIVQNVLDMAGKKVHRARTFSEEGWSEIREYHTRILETFTWAISALTSGDEDLARRVLRSVEHLNRRYEELRVNHLSRLQAGLKESFETSSIHLDTLSAFSRVGNLLAELVKPIQEAKF